MKPVQPHGHKSFSDGGKLDLTGGGVSTTTIIADLAGVYQPLSILDTAGLYAATDVEGALAEIARGTTFLHNIEALGDIPLGLAEL